MAYKRPLSPRQSFIITALWLVFAIAYLSRVPITLFSLIILGISAFVVFYPIQRSRKQTKSKRHR